MASSSRLHSEMHKKSSVINNPEPQWIKDLDPNKRHHAIALRAFQHPGCRPSKNSCKYCSSKNVECFTAPAVSTRCVRCIVRTKKCEVDSSDSDDNYSASVEMNPVRGEGPTSDATSAAAYTMEAHTEKVRTSFKPSHQPKMAFEQPAFVAASAGALRRNAADEEGSFEVPQRSRPSIQTKPTDKLETLLPTNLKHGHYEPDPTAEARNNKRQLLTATEPSPAQSCPLSTPLTASPNFNRQSFSRHASSLSSAPRTSIHAYKQDNTTLWISVPSSSDAVAVKLRSCMTTSSLFDSALKACGLAEQQGKVLGLRTSFLRQRNADANKTLMVKRELEESFEVFMEIIDGLPDWKREGVHCSVDIEVILKDECEY